MGANSTDPDLIVANHETDYVTVQFGGEGANERRADSRIVVGVSPHPHAVQVADIDQDGHLDLLADDRGAEALAVFLGLATKASGTADRFPWAATRTAAWSSRT